MTDTALSAVETERAVLGSILIDPEAFYMVSPLMRATDLQNHKHRVIFKAMEHLADNGSPIDIVTLTRILEKRGSLKRAGNASYLSGLIDVVPSAMNAVTYAETVVDAARRRSLESVASELGRRVYDGAEDTDETITWATQALQKRGAGGNLVRARDVVDDLHDEMERYAHNPLDDGEVRGEDTGWIGINKLTGGWHSGLYVIFGEPHVGKTYFMLHAAANVADRGKRVLFFELEMSARDLVRRLCLAYANVSRYDYDHGRMTPGQTALFVEREGQIADWNLDITDSIDTAGKIIATIHREARGDNPPALVCIDYLGLVVFNGDAESENYKIAALTRALKNTERTLDIPIMTAHQISGKAIAHRQDKRPKKSDGYGSSGIEQHADVILGLYQDQMHREDTESPNILEVINLKDRLSGQADAFMSARLFFAPSGKLKDAAVRGGYR